MTAFVIEKADLERYMNGADLLAQIEECAIFFYQNKEQKAYERLQKLLPQINAVLQKVEEGSEIHSDMVQTVAAFLEAIQRKHTLALADLLTYDLPKFVRGVEMEKQP